MEDDKLENPSRASFMKVLAPCCNIHLHWIGPPGSELQSLFHDVEISGTDDPECFFTISYCPGQYSTVAVKDEQATSKQPAAVLDTSHLQKLVL